LILNKILVPEPGSIFHLRIEARVDTSFSLADPEPYRPLPLPLITPPYVDASRSLAENLNPLSPAGLSIYRFVLQTARTQIVFKQIPGPLALDGPLYIPHSRDASLFLAENFLPSRNIRFPD
jgi:hypothetical protein